MNETLQPALSDEENDDEVSELNLKLSDIFSDVPAPNNNSNYIASIAPVTLPTVDPVPETPSVEPIHMDSVENGHHNGSQNETIVSWPPVQVNAETDVVPRPSFGEAGTARPIGIMFRRAVQSLFQQWWKVLIVVLLFTGLGYIVIQALPKTFRATTVFVLKPQSRTIEGLPSPEARIQLAQTYVDLLQHSPTVDTTMSSFGLDYAQFQDQVQFRVVPNTWLIELTVDNADVALAKDLSEAVLDASETSKFITEGLPEQEREIIDAAEIIELPPPVDPQLIMLIAITLGLILSVGKVLVDGHNDDIFENVDAVQEATLLPILTSVPPSKRNMTLLFADDPGSPFSEAYQILSARLKIAHLDHGFHILQLTSPTPQKRASDTAINVGISLAKAGYRVLLVDVNLREPQLHEAFNLPQEPGLSDLISEKRPFDMTQIYDVFPNLFVLPGGTLSFDPPAVLNMPYVDDLFAQFKAHVDIILLHTPPVLSAAESTVLMAKVDGTIMAVNLTQTPRSAVLRAAETLHNVGANALGLILTDVPKAVSDEYYEDFTKSDQFKRQADDVIPQLAQSAD